MQKCSEIDTFEFDAWNEDENSKQLHTVKMSTAQTNIKIMTRTEIPN